MTGPVEAYMIHDYAEARRRLTNGHSGTSVRPKHLQLDAMEAEVKAIRMELAELQRRVLLFFPRHRHTTPVNGTVHLLINLISEHENISRDDILSHRRQKEIARARHMLIWLSCKATDLSMPAIARQIGNRNHTTIMHSRDEVFRLMKADDKLAKRLDWYLDKLKKLTVDLPK